MTNLSNIFKKSARSLLCTPYKFVLNHLDSPVIVLLYHRVTALTSDPEMLAVTPDNFRAHMRYLKEHVPLVRFDEDWSKVTKPAVVITFDDGYADNALEALPILEEVGVPATFFVSTGTIGTAREFWWHELERMFLGQQDLPSRFTLEDELFGKSWLTGTSCERQECYRGIVALMTAVDVVRRDSWLGQLRNWGQSDVMTGVNPHRSLTTGELQLLAKSPWTTIGAHTMTHTQLSSIPADRQREEIGGSKKQLETWLDQEITVFSYPFGKRCHYTAETVTLCRDAGFIKAASNFPGQVHRWTDPYQIPRHLVRDWSVDTFVKRLKGFWTR
jgi:peptidoglycan/xylan/chitin deacetylase (PgdA/CDA1 family)